MATLTVKDLTEAYKSMQSLQTDAWFLAKPDKLIVPQALQAQAYKVLFEQDPVESKPTLDDIIDKQIKKLKGGAV